MTRLGVRVVLVLAGLLATAAAGHRAWQDEIALGDARQASAAADRSAETALHAIGDIRSSMHAYVAPGQGVEFWSTRTAALLDTLRQHVLEIDAAAAARGASLADTLDGLDQLVAAERRARHYVESGQVLLSGDVIFVEVRDLLAAAAAQVELARQVERRLADARRAALRQEQAALGAAAAGVWLVVALFLLPRAYTAAPASTEAAGKADDLDAQAPRPNAADADLDLPLDAGSPSAQAIAAASGAPGGPDAPVRIAEICSDLASLTDLGALTGALARAAEVLGATGVIVWVAASDGSHLRAVAQHGFDPRLLSRIGTIPRDAANLTAAAFRGGSAQVSAATADSPAALAVALRGPSGSVGVFSAELRTDADPGLIAWATILAAQLATLAQPVPQPSTGDPAWPRHAQA